VPSHASAATSTADSRTSTAATEVRTAPTTDSSAPAPAATAASASTKTAAAASAAGQKFARQPSQREHTYRDQYVFFHVSTWLWLLLVFVTGFGR
jgi:hypothetical protein